MTSGSQASGGAALAASEEEKFTDRTGVKTDQNGEEKAPAVIRFYGVLSSEERAYFKSFDQVSRGRMDKKSRQHFEKKEKEGISLLPVERSYFDAYKKSDYQEDRLVGNEVWKMRPSHKELVDYLAKKEELDKECPDWDRNPFYTRVEVEKRLARDQLAKERVRKRAAELERLTCLELLEGNFSQEEAKQKWESVDKELLDLSKATLEPAKTDKKNLPEELQTSPEEEERRVELGNLLDQIDEKLDYLENLKELGKFQQWQDRLKEQQALMPRAEWGKLKTVEYHMKEAVRSAKELQDRRSGEATGEEASEETPEELDSDDAYDTRVLKVPDLTVSELEVAESRARLQYHIRIYNEAPDKIKKYVGQDVKSRWNEYIILTNCCPTLAKFGDEIHVKLEDTLEANEDAMWGKYLEEETVRQQRLQLWVREQQMMLRERTPPPYPAHIAKMSKELKREMVLLLQKSMEMEELLKNLHQSSLEKKEDGTCRPILQIARCETWWSCKSSSSSTTAPASSYWSTRQR